MSNTVAIMPCSCKNDWQDKKYGRGQRVHNLARKPQDHYRCTVCGKDK